MIINTYLYAFGNGETREVDIPDDTDALPLVEQLEVIFHYGQNDFQYRPKYSLSVGDIIDLKEQRYLIKGVGFHELTDNEFERWKAIPQRDRSFGVLMGASQ